MALENPEKPAGVQSGLAEKTPIKAPEKQLSKPDADYDGSAKQTRGEKSAGNGFTWKQHQVARYGNSVVGFPPFEEPTPEGMSGPPIGGERNWERDATGSIATRGEFEAPVKERALPASEGLASRRRCGY